jgi:hypothetical protein
MTIETNTTLELGDVTAIEFECESCHTKTVLPVAKFKNAPIHCPFCKESPQWFIPGSRDFADVNVLGRVIQWFSSAEKPKGFVMRFHIMNPSASAREGV